MTNYADKQPRPLFACLQGRSQGRIVRHWRWKTPVIPSLLAVTVLLSGSIGCRSTERKSNAAVLDAKTSQPAVAPGGEVLPQGSPPPARPTHGDSRASVDKMAEQARSLTSQFQTQLKAELMRGMAEGGPSAAIAVCQKRAPQIAGEVLQKAGKSDWKMGRTAQRLRNSSNAPNEWQSRGLAALKEAQLEGAGDSVADWQDRSEPKEFRFMSAILTGAPCLGCHGEPASLHSSVRDKLAQLYPSDSATGFSLGELRGAFYLTAPRPAP